MKLAGIFIGLINAATMVVAADASQESTIISHTLREDVVNKHVLAYAFYRPETLIAIINFVDTSLSFDWKKTDHESGFELTITGSPKSVQSVENHLKICQHSLTVLECQVPFSPARSQYLKFVQQKEHQDKTSQLSMHMSEKKEEQPIDIYVITTKRNEEQARQMQKLLVIDYCEEVITCEPENLGKLEADIVEKCKELPMNAVKICSDRAKSAFYVAGTNPQFTNWVAVIKDLVERKSKAKEDTASKHYILVKDHQDVVYGDIAIVLSGKLSVRSGKIEKSKIYRGFLEVPLPQSRDVDRAVVLKNLIIDRCGREISLPILDPRNPAHIEGIMGSRVSEKETPKIEQVNYLDRDELSSRPDGVIRSLASSF